MHGKHTSSDLGTRGRMTVQMDRTRLISSITASGMSSKSILRRMTMVSRCAFRNSRTCFDGQASVMNGRFGSYLHTCEVAVWWEPPNVINTPLMSWRVGTNS